MEINWKVAPLAGAWIETKYNGGYHDDIRVAPLAGAWIETIQYKYTKQIYMSRPSRARGLKRRLNRRNGSSATVAPLAGAWIETINKSLTVFLVCVAPLAGAWIETINFIAFRPVSFVAPLAGAWIETVCSDFHVLNVGSRAPRGRVD